MGISSASLGCEGLSTMGEKKCLDAIASRSRIGVPGLSKMRNIGDSGSNRRTVGRRQRACGVAGSGDVTDGSERRHLTLAGRQRARRRRRMHVIEVWRSMPCHDVVRRVAAAFRVNRRATFCGTGCVVDVARYGRPRNAADLSSGALATGSLIGSSTKPGGAVKRSQKLIITYALAIVAFALGYVGGLLVITWLFHLHDNDVRGIVSSAIGGALVGGTLVVGRRWAGPADPSAT
jgi:hypothetical protein